MDKKFYPWVAPWFIMLVTVILVLMPSKGIATPFTWNRDQLWSQLEQRFVESRSKGCDPLTVQISTRIDKLGELAETLLNQPTDPMDVIWDEAEIQMLELAPLLAACPVSLSKYKAAVARLQRAVKKQAITWPPEASQTRQRLYRVIYGGRSAIEEILLQAPEDKASEIWAGENQPSAAPSITVHGVRIYSGDMLVTRGGAATSALIARGSDYPGNFSHVALVHVDADTGEASVIEALIEYGVVISSVQSFLEDKKLRIMVLRLRQDLPAVVKTPTIAHKAAQWAYDKARQNQIDYDFEMDFRNHEKLFCAEVVFAAYESVNIRLWSGLSHISAAGTARWLEAFGVKNFITLEPSDLEYDPQLNRVVEWHDAQTLFKDHVHNAVTDALLEGANAGAPLKYNRFLLPVAWGTKIYSYIQSKRGRIGPIPKGMSSAAALKNRWYSQRHARLVEDVDKTVEIFSQEKGYRPPYWELVRMARQHHDEQHQRF